MTGTVHLVRQVAGTDTGQLAICTIVRCWRYSTAQEVDTMPIRGGRAYRQHTTYKQAILKRDGYRCQACGCGIGDACSGHAPVRQMDVAHKVAWADGGSSTPANQVAMCHPCNQRDRKFKHPAPTLDQFFARLEAQVRS